MEQHFKKRKLRVDGAASPCKAAAPPVVLTDAAALQRATDALAAADPRLAPLIQEFGLAEPLLRSQSQEEGNCFNTLTKSILYQQLAGTAAAAIYSRFLEACGAPDHAALTPQAVLDADAAALRACGLSGRKAEYVRDLAAHFQDGRLSHDAIVGADPSELEALLTRVKGIGPWTVHMLAMFHLGHADVLPAGDLGVRRGMQALCGLKELPSPEAMEALTEAWQPYRSIGAFYMWKQPTDGLPKKQRGAGKGATKKAGGGSDGSSGGGGPKGRARRPTERTVDL